jgi:hypothetical protein
MAGMHVSTWYVYFCIDTSMVDMFVRVYAWACADAVWSEATCEFRCETATSATERIVHTHTRTYIHVTTLCNSERILKKSKHQLNRIRRLIQHTCTSERRPAWQLVAVNLPEVLHLSKGYPPFAIQRTSLSLVARQSAYRRLHPTISSKYCNAPLHIFLAAYSFAASA